MHEFVDLSAQFNDPNAFFESFDVCFSGSDDLDLIFFKGHFFYLGDFNKFFLAKNAVAVKLFKFYNIILYFTPRLQQLLGGSPGVENKIIETIFNAVDKETRDMPQ
jgi:hypothetical protein